MTQRRLFVLPDGKHAWTAKQPTYVKSWTEENGIPDGPVGSIADRYIAAIRGYLNGQVTWKEMYTAISSKACTYIPIGLNPYTIEPEEEEEVVHA